MKRPRGPVILPGLKPQTRRLLLLVPALALALIPAGRAAAQGPFVGARVLVLSESPGEDRWLAELEERLNETPRAAPFAVIRRAVTDGDSGLLDQLLGSYAPAFVVAFPPLSQRSMGAIRSRGIALRVEKSPPRDAGGAAAEILRTLGAALPPSGASREERLAAERARARAHLRFGEDAAAEAALQRLHALAPEDREPLRELIRLRRTKRPWGALAAADLMAALPGLSAAQRADALLVSGALRARVGDSAGAGRDLERVLALRPGDAEALLGLAMEKRGLPHEALRFARRAVASGPRDRRARRVVAEILLDLDERGAAQDSLRLALALAPDDLETLSLMVRASASRPEAARAHAARALAVAEAAPRWHRADAYRLCARMHLEMNDPDGAAALYHRALTIDPEDLLALQELSRLRLDFPGAAPRTLDESAHPEAPSYDLSEAAALRALAASPGDLDALSQLLAIRRDQGRLEEASALAVRFLDAALEAPAWLRPSAYRLVARLAWEVGDAERARFAAKELDRWVLDEARYRMRPAGGGLEYKASEVSVAELRALLGDEAGAQRRLSLVLAVFPDDLEALRVQIRLAAARGALPEALSWAERLVAATAQASPDERAAAYARKAQLQLDLKDEAGAEKSFLQALRWFPDGPALSSLLHITRGQRRFAEALSYADRLVKASAAAPARERAAALLQKAQVQLELKEAEGAHASLSEALRLEPEGPALAMQLQLALTRRLFSEALPLAQALETLNARAPAEKRAEGFLQKARIQLELKDEAAAERSLDQALSLAPEGPALPLRLQLLLSQRRYADALPFADRLEAAGARSPPAERAAAFAVKAQIQLELADEAGAEKSLRESLRLHAEGPALAALLHLEMTRGRFAEALAHAEALEAMSGRSPPAERAAALAVKAQIQLGLKDEAAAEKSLRESLRLDGDGAALPMLVHLATAQRRYREALSLARRLEKASAKAPPAERTQVLALKARIQRELKDEDGAQASLREALRLQPDGAALPLSLEVALARRRFPEALAYAERLEKAHAAAEPRRRAADFARKAQILLELKDEDGARRSLEESARLDPAGGALPLLMRIALSQRRFNEALSHAESLEAASAEAPPSALAAVLTQKAEIQLELGDAAGAEESLSRALTADPGDMEALWRIFEARRGAPAEALRAVASRRPPAAGPQAAWLALLGHARALGGDRDGARRDLSAAVALDAEGVCFGPSFEKRRGRLDPVYFDLCLERRPSSAALHSDRGVARYLAGDPEGALADFRRAIALEAGHLEAHLNLLSILTGSGRRAEALAAADAAAAAAGGRPSPVRDRIMEMREALRRAPSAP